VNTLVQVVGQIIGTLVGGVMTFLGGFTQQWMASNREREARREEIEARRTQQRQDSQIQTLLALQGLPVANGQKTTLSRRPARS